MAQCHGDIVYRSVEREGTVADDDAALVTAYEKALKSLQGTRSADKPKPTEEFLQVKDDEEQLDDHLLVPQQKWTVGSQCLAKWSEDGLLYPAVVVWIKTQRCRVKFDGYGNEEELYLSELLPEVVEQPSDNQQWRLGARCRAVWSGDGLIYPAVLVSVEGQRGRVLFDAHGNEEELELSALLHPEQQEPDVNTLTEATGTSIVFNKQSVSSGKAWRWDPDSSSSSDWMKMEKQKILASKEDFSATSLLSCSDDTGEGQSCDCCDKQKKQRSKKGVTKEGAQPPFCMPPRYLSFPPPPSVLPPRNRALEGSNVVDSDVADLSSLLLSWYLCGYHTGYYMASRQTKSGNERVEEKRKTSYKRGNCKT